MPWLDWAWTNNWLVRQLRGNFISPGVVFAMRRVAERKGLEKAELQEDWGRNNRDMLSRFMEVEANDSTVPPT